MRFLGPAQLLLGLSTLAFSVASCTDLPEIPDHVCGNAIVEVDRGEECDTFPQGGSSGSPQCRTAGQTDACRFDCTKAADGSGPSCPTGLGCGLDGVCRKASSRFSKLGAPVGDGEAAIFLGDFDGDGRKDLLAEGASQLTVDYFDEGGALGATLQIPAYPAIPAIGRFADENTDDFTVGFSFGVGVLHGRTDRTVSQLSFSTISLTELKDSYILEMDALTDGQYPLDETLVIASQNKNAAVFALDPAGGSTLLFGLPAPPSELAADVAIANLVPSTPCKDLALGYKGGSELLIRTPCKSATEYAGPLIQPPPVALPAGTKLESGPFAVDLDGDGITDLAAGTTCSPTKAVTDCVAIVVSFGDATGGFHANKNGPANGKASIFATFDGGGTADMTPYLPLAVGEIDGDSMFDFVGVGGIFANFGTFAAAPQDGFSCFYFAAQGDGAWTSAQIVDLNENGVPDVLAASDARTGLDFFNGAGGGLFSRFIVPTHGKVRHFAVGDFDGDLLPDVALAETGDANATGEALQDSLTVAFGRAFGGPAAPVSRGRLGTIRRIAVGYIVDFGFDATADLAVVSSHDKGAADTLALFPGTTDRQLQAPLILFRQDAGKSRDRNDPKAIGLGSFDSDPHPDLAILTQEQIGKKGGVLGGFRLWHVPSSGGGQIDIAKASSIPMPTEYAYDPDLTRILPLDLDANGTQELIVTGLDATAKAGAFYVGHVESGAWTLTPRAPPAGTLFGYPEAAMITAAAKHVPDVVVVRAQPSAADPSSYAVDLVLLPNDGAGGLDVEHPIVIPQGDDPAYIAVVIQADADPEQELVVLSPNAAYLVDWDRTRRAFSAMKQIADAPGGIDLRAGDIDGDGIDDIAISTTSGVQIMRGVPVNP